MKATREWQTVPFQILQEFADRLARRKHGTLALVPQESSLAPGLPIYWRRLGRTTQVVILPSTVRVPAIGTAVRTPDDDFKTHIPAADLGPWCPGWTAWREESDSRGLRIALARAIRDYCYKDGKP